MIKPRRAYADGSQPFDRLRAELPKAAARLPTVTGLRLLSMHNRLAKHWLIVTGMCTQVSAKGAAMDQNNQSSKLAKIARWMSCGVSTFSSAPIRTGRSSSGT